MKVGFQYLMPLVAGGWQNRLELKKSRKKTALTLVFGSIMWPAQKIVSGSRLELFVCKPFPVQFNKRAWFLHSVMGGFVQQALPSCLFFLFVFPSRTCQYVKQDHETRTIKTNQAGICIMTTTI